MKKTVTLLVLIITGLNVYSQNTFSKITQKVGSNLEILVHASIISRTLRIF